MSPDNIITCDKCNTDFLVSSVKIEERSVEIGGTVLLLNYFTCPSCKTVYRVLLVDEAHYRELVDDLVSTKKRIRRLQGKGNAFQLGSLQKMAARKAERIQQYVQSMNKKYPGTFTLLASENNQQDEIKYLP